MALRARVEGGEAEKCAVGAYSPAKMHRVGWYASCHSIERNWGVPPPVRSQLKLSRRSRREDWRSVGARVTVSGWRQSGRRELQHFKYGDGKLTAQGIVIAANADAPIPRITENLHGEGPWHRRGKLHILQLATITPNKSCSLNAAPALLTMLQTAIATPPPGRPAQESVKSSGDSSPASRRAPQPITSRLLSELGPGGQGLHHKRCRDWPACA
ncbi:hypothetical protein NA57DRAFT_62009 [Rhizodiscina lignyota]|uniref:Uncharacterized protein n=1 Tax=Rhizodiscina lignyota TaxID=1504668 RepID=A0A9P4M340_9PEZI|nr:hypothetical protein NA57DRAFT_62009 [Rhizodiscina lignyota]